LLQGLYGVDVVAPGVIYIVYRYLLSYLLWRSQKLESQKANWLPRAKNWSRKLRTEVDVLGRDRSPGRNPGSKRYFGHKNSLKCIYRVQALLVLLHKFIMHCI